MNTRKGSHVAFRLNAHLIFVTKYRQPRFTSQHLSTMEHLAKTACDANDASINEFNGEQDHVHFLVDLNQTSFSY